MKGLFAGETKFMWRMCRFVSIIFKRDQDIHIKFIYICIKISKPNHVKWVDHKCQNWLLNNKIYKKKAANEMKIYLKIFCKA